VLVIIWNETYNVSNPTTEKISFYDPHQLQLDFIFQSIKFSAQIILLIFSTLLVAKKFCQTSNYQAVILNPRGQQLHKLNNQMRPSKAFVCCLNLLTKYSNARISSDSKQNR
jgi:hypothetical protein